MYRGCSVGVVVPAYQEAGFVGDVVASVPAYVDRVYVVDDASTDGTWSEIRRAARDVNETSGTDSEANAAAVPAGPETPDGGRRVLPIRHAENRGVGAAIKTGYRRALADGLDVTAVMAGDGQMDPDRLDALLDPIVEGRAEYAKGNRLVRASWREEMPRLRLVGNAVLALLTKVASGYWRVGDPQNGYTAISRAALEAVDLDRMYEFYGYCNDLLVRLAVADARVADVPIPPAYGDERSHIDLRSYVPRVSAMLLRTFVWRLAVTFRRDRNPAAVLYPAGALAGLLGVWDLVRRLLADPDVDGAGESEGDGRNDAAGDARPAASLTASALLLAAAAAVEWVSTRRLGFRERVED